MEAEKFIHSWTALWLWAQVLQTQLAGARLVQAYTHHKGQLDLQFLGADGASILSWTTAAQRARLHLSNRSSVPGKRVGVLRGFPSESALTRVWIHADDRLLKLSFAADHQLILGFFPAALNAFHIHQNVCLEVFFKKPGLQPISENWLDPLAEPPETISGPVDPQLLRAAREGIWITDSGLLAFGGEGSGEGVKITELERRLALIKHSGPRSDPAVNMQKMAQTLQKRWTSKLAKMEQEYETARSWPDTALELQGLQIAQAMGLPTEGSLINIPAELAPLGKNFMVLLNPGESLQEAIETAARRIRKAKAKLELLQPQMEQVRTDIRQLGQLQEGGSPADLLAFLNTHGEALDGRGRQQTERTPYKKYPSPGGFDILVGKGARDNDNLTFKIAHKNDFWFHARQISGSHVILRCGNQQPGQADIQKAAEYAALNSQAKHAGIVVIQYCQRKHLSKPRGSAPGMVLVHQERSITIDLDLL